MKMIDAKKEIEEKLYQNTPLSLETMLCALAALNAYIDENGRDSFVMLNIQIDENSETNRKATEIMCDMLKQSMENSEQKAQGNCALHIFIDGG